MDEALYDSFRFNLSRQIVGEVRGREVIAMIKAMESGAGSISTTHAANAEAALRKLVTCAMEAGAHVTHEYATRAIAENIDWWCSCSWKPPCWPAVRRAATGGCRRSSRSPRVSEKVRHNPRLLRRHRPGRGRRGAAR